jgi:hypothetical protein
MGANSDMDPLLPGTRFHLDFGFIRASSADFGVSEVNHVFTSYDGNNIYLLIVCAKSHHTLIFLQGANMTKMTVGCDEGWTSLDH